MIIFKKIIVKYKWKILRYLFKCRKIRINKMMLRLYYIQELKNKHNSDKLIKLSYKKLRRMFIKEFPNKCPHNPKADD